MSAHIFQNILNFILLSLVTGVPLLLLFGCCFSTLRTASFRLLPWSSLPVFLALLFIAPGDEVRAPWFFMGSSMGLDETGRIFLFLTGLVWLFSSLSVREKFQQDPHRFRFAGYFLASMSGNFGLIMARDILGFYLFFALMSFSAYGLIIHNRTQKALKAGRVYLMLVFLSELAMFTALVIFSRNGSAPAIGSIPGADFHLLLVILLFIAFGVKIGALPFQSWMVLSYQETPVPAAIALAGAMVNAGIIGWLRFFPFGQVVLPGGAAFFIVFGAAAALYGVVFGLYQGKIGRVLASSSISQMGLLTVIAGYGLLSSDAGRSALTLMTIFAVHHTLAKTSLFLGYDLIERTTRVAGIILLAGLLVPSFSLSGLPLTSGAMVKGSIKDLTTLGSEFWYLFGKIFLPLSSLGTTVLMLHCVRLFRQQSTTARQHGKTPGTALWAASVIGVMVVPWLWPPLRHLAGHSLQPSALLHSLWPVLLGVILALAWFVIGSRLPGRGLAAVDSDSLLRRSYEGFMRVLARFTDGLDSLQREIKAKPIRQRLEPLPSRFKNPGKWEKILGRWSVVGLCYLMICILFFMIMLTSWIFAGTA